jgi:CRISPR-associated protein Cas1
MSLVIHEDFHFTGRSKRPPRDPFNSLLSFGYTLLHNEIYISAACRGLNPYVGVMHRLRNGHPALASDLMEEWRPLIVDSMVLKLLNGGTFKAVDFTVDSHTGGVYLNRQDSRQFIRHFETRLLQTNKYVEKIEAPMTFRETLQYQINALVNALEQNDSGQYNAVMIR